MLTEREVVADSDSDTVVRLVVAEFDTDSECVSGKDTDKLCVMDGDIDGDGDTTTVADSEALIPLTVDVRDTLPLTLQEVVRLCDREPVDSDSELEGVRRSVTERESVAERLYWCE